MTYALKGGIILEIKRKNTVAKISQCVKYATNARTHSPEQINQIAASIKEFGFVNPIIIDDGMNIIAGHGRVMAAQSLGMGDCIR